MKKLNTPTESLKLTPNAQHSLNNVANASVIVSIIGFFMSFLLLIIFIYTKIEGHIFFMKGLGSVFQIAAFCLYAIPSYFLLIFGMGTKKSIKTKDSIKLKENIACLSIASKFFFIAFLVITCLFILMIVIDSL
ncbi:MAG: hypothetical protein LBG80_17155 [Bacteroidales bacterium]|jgi:hypothetical protein|nr:hypothetical protein [Bacteroidales bacterium]